VDESKCEALKWTLAPEEEQKLAGRNRKHEGGLQPHSSLLQRHPEIWWRANLDYKLVSDQTAEINKRASRQTVFMRASAEDGEKTTHLN
jgi:hypothetical protein